MYPCKIVHLCFFSDIRYNSAESPISGAKSTVTVYNDLYRQFLREQKQCQNSDISKTSTSRSTATHPRLWTVFSHRADQYKYRVLCH